MIGDIKSKPLTRYKYLLQGTNILRKYKNIIVMNAFKVPNKISTILLDVSPISAQ